MRVLVLGIGNVMFGDEGAGVHFVKTIEKNYQFFADSDSAKIDKDATNTNSSPTTIDQTTQNPSSDSAKTTASAASDSAKTDQNAKNPASASPKNEVVFIDGGTLAGHLTPIIAGFDHLIVVDCIDADDGEVGEVYFFDFDNIPKKVNWSGSAHEIEMLQTLAMMDLVGDRPPTHILAVIPKRIKPMSFELSNELQKACILMEQTLLKHLQNLGFSHQKIADFSVADTAKEWEKSQFNAAF